MNIYEFDKTKPFGRGKFLRSIIWSGTPCRMAKFNGNIVYHCIYAINEKKEVKITAQSLGVKAFMVSNYYILQDKKVWETYLVGSIEGMVFDIPKDINGNPMLSKDEIAESGILI